MSYCNWFSCRKRIIKGGRSEWALDELCESCKWDLLCEILLEVEGGRIPGSVKKILSLAEVMKDDS